MLKKRHKTTTGESGQKKTTNTVSAITVLNTNIPGRNPEVTNTGRGLKIAQDLMHIQGVAQVSATALPVPPDLQHYLHIPFLAKVHWFSFLEQCSLGSLLSCPDLHIYSTQ